MKFPRKNIYLSKLQFARLRMCYKMKFYGSYNNENLSILKVSLISK